MVRRDALAKLRLYGPTIERAAFLSWTAEGGGKYKKIQMVLTTAGKPGLSLHCLYSGGRWSEICLFL